MTTIWRDTFLQVYNKRELKQNDPQHTCWTGILIMKHIVINCHNQSCLQRPSSAEVNWSPKTQNIYIVQPLDVHSPLLNHLHQPSRIIYMWQPQCVGVNLTVIRCSQMYYCKPVSVSILSVKCYCGVLALHVKLFILIPATVPVGNVRVIIISCSYSPASCLMYPDFTPISPDTPLRITCVGKSAYTRI